MKALGKFRSGAGALTVVSFLFVGLLALIPSSASKGAAENHEGNGKLSYQKGNEAKGKYFYIKECKTCHGKGGRGGEITPMSKTQAQWLDYFDRGKHLKGAEPLTKYAKEEELNDMLKFLHNHAIDSPQPETCGQ